MRNTMLGLCRRCRRPPATLGLNLSEAQKVDAQKIMDSGLHGKERREAMAKVLTLEQAAKLKTLLDQQKAQQQPK